MHRGYFQKEVNLVLSEKFSMDKDSIALFIIRWTIHDLRKIKQEMQFTGSPNIQQMVFLWKVGPGQ